MKKQIIYVSVALVITVVFWFMSRPVVQCVEFPSCKDGDMLTITHMSGKDTEEQIIYSREEYVCKGGGWVKKEGGGE